MIVFFFKQKTAYEMRISDWSSDVCSSDLLGLLDIDTVLEADKQLRNVTGRLLPGGVPVSGYEIHAGVSCGPALEQPAVQLDDGRFDGAISPDEIGRASCRERVCQYV